MLWSQIIYRRISVYFLSNNRTIHGARLMAVGVVQCKVHFNALYDAQ